MSSHTLRPAAAALLLLCPSAAAAAAAGQAVAPRPVHTYSIVARDPATGDLGVAVQSHWFSVGALVPWAEAGIGAVATQSFVRVEYGPEGLAAMRKGEPAPAALARLVQADDERAVRQVAMVDVSGRAGAHTGERCIQAAGHHVGQGYSVQANLMLDAGVWPAMAAAYEASPGDLAERMLAALEAAQSAGGDIRGSQSAAMLIVKGRSTGTPWKDKVLDLRIEDHPQPIRELRRLVELWRAYERMNAGDLAVEKNDMEGAARHYAAAEAMFPAMDEFVFWHAAALAQKGRVDEALPLFRKAFLLQPAWWLLVPRLPSSGLLPEDKSTIDRILAAGPSAR
ncbi:MAG TPA: DUF1028 domain-containing protein [Candidatus Polarisedimenticolia bacterium]|nr:DUF1028 domain-containing protein [Candidatus Polarisedimenticolia bacterium]